MKIQWQRGCRFAAGSKYTDSTEVPVQYSTPQATLAAVLESEDPEGRQLHSRDQEANLELRIEAERISKVLTQLGLSVPTLKSQIP